MLKKATCFAALLLMAACSSGSVSDDSSKDQSAESAPQEKPVANNSDVDAYELNETTLSGEQNNNDFVNKLDDEDLVAALREGGHVIYIRHAKTNKDWGDQIRLEVLGINSGLISKWNKENVSQSVALARYLMQIA